MSENVKGILLTWNPGKYNAGGDGTKEFSTGLSVGESHRWSCNTTKVNVGDVVYLIRLGVEPRGIVARGVVTNPSYTDKDWGDDSKNKRYIKFSVEDLREDCAVGLLPMVLLNTVLPEQSWSPQSSGIEIKADTLPKLQDLWSDGKGKHSLRQYVDWQLGHLSEGTADWLERYRQIIALAGAIREHRASPDEAALIRLWREKDNGVTGLGPGVLPAAVFSENIGFLHEITERIFTKPDHETFLSVLDTWEEAVKSGAFDSVRRAAIKRTFAAFAPESYTTLLNDSDCLEMLGLLDHKFQLKVEERGLWTKLNSSIKHCMDLAGLDAEKLLENNVAMWRLLVASNKGKQDADAIRIAEMEEMTQDKTSQVTTVELNQILFGPPGTGKTHSVVDEALRILDPDTLADPTVTREKLVARFNYFQSEGQVVFCTFHQSFAYEDFVEGLRAFTESGTVNYRVEDGVFKKLCMRAGLGRTAASDPFDNALLILKEQFDANDGRLVMSTTKGHKFGVEYDGGDTFKVFPQSSAETQKYDYRANMNLVRQLYQTGSKEGIYNVSYVDGMLSWLSNQCGLPPYQPAQSSPEQQDKFVLIIDEINRGNISRIFGELITLIEPSKRAGIGEGLAVVLPYSKKEFSVPANLYLIGTMNTADRSLAGLDIALRRRFTFKEMPPQPELLKDVDIGDVNVGQLLDVMNQRIELLLDRDHCLGHAYFMSLKNGDPLEKLAFIFRQQILPLLQEYFFEDWERIAWVLNDQEKPKENRFLQKISANLAGLFGANTSSKLQNVEGRWRINEAAFGNIDSYSGIVEATE